MSNKINLQDVYKQIDDVQEKQRFFLGTSNLSLKKLLFILGFIVFLAWYLYVVFFGDNSYRLVNNLKLEKLKLQQEIKKLQESNVKLKKKYFELKSINEFPRNIESFDNE
jgi:cell division protein FtsB